MQQSVLLAAESATNLLRASVKEHPAVYGDAAKKMAGQLRDRASVARGAVDIVRGWTAYDLRARHIVAECDHLAAEAERQAAQLDERGRYTGLLRSQMGDDEKIKYVREHGKESYLSLPW